MRHQSIEFSVSPEMNALESLGSGGWRGAYFAMGEMTNGSEHDDLEALKAEAVREALDRFTPESLREDPVLDGFRTLHRDVGRANRKTIPSPEKGRLGPFSGTFRMVEYQCVVARKHYPTIQSQKVQCVINPSNFQSLSRWAKKIGF